VNGVVGPRADTTEVYAALTYSILTAKVNYAATNEYGWKNSDGSYYLDLTANYPVPAEWTGISGLSVIGHVGHQKINAALADTSNASASYTDYKVGASKAWDNGVTVGGYWTKTTANENVYQFGDGNTNKSIGAPALTVFATKTF
jgi:uncharacterized protein (TIGR02001 family)